MIKAPLSRAIVKPDAKDIEQTKSGIFTVTDYVEPTTTTGVILTISPKTQNGEDYEDTEPELVPGTKILYKNRTIRKNEDLYNPLEFTVDGEKYISIEIADIYGVYSE